MYAELAVIHLMSTPSELDDAISTLNHSQHSGSLMKINYQPQFHYLLGVSLGFEIDRNFAVAGPRNS